MLTLEDIVRLARSVREGIPEESVRRFACDLDRLLFAKVAPDLYLNLKASPPATIGDAVHRLFPGAVVSLQTALGSAGVTNNFTPHYHCVIASEDAQSPTGDTEVMRIGDVAIHLHRIPLAVLEGGDPADRLNPVSTFPLATPEAAIVHWHYLGRHAPGSYREPDTQTDLSELDLEQVARLSVATDLWSTVSDWIERVRDREESDDCETVFHS